MLHLPSLIDATELREIAGLLASAPWTDGRASAGEQAAQAKNNEQLAPDSEAARAAQAIVLRALERSPQFLAAALPKKLFPPRFNRYSGARNQYGAHVDNAVRFTENGVRVRTDLSCTLFLSNPDGYEGGELVIHEGSHTRSAKFAAGDAVLYAGTTVHEVMPVTRGERLASFFWIESMVRSDEQRHLLHDFDMALMGLRETHGDSAGTIALTGTYHNLLRMWADT
ncbi:Fe2+-dependent dioxygenase [Caenimonas sp. SL110]|uniref:Fe2+-dependent dioxygenase n=1 Tax=Caenimonas sp. SL110 TaxID=1450524 RepID=UPI0006545830|nr:Fe2+-dependent dioxygenase [Caenimonas sp. SL110]